MTDIEEQQLAVQFANFLRKVPHRADCLRTLKKSQVCSCDIGDPALQVFNQFVELLTLAKAQQ